MTGSLAQTIQGEAGANPANQFAVASTIFNRMNAGNFPGGSDPYAIVNAPQQFVGYSATPNSTAQAFADAIQNGTLPNYGNTGNAVNFQSGQTAANNGFTNGGANIGGNFFSDRFGAPTSNFVAPSYGGSGSTIAAGPPDASSGVAGGTNNAGVGGELFPGSGVTGSLSATPSTGSGALTNSGSVAQGTKIQTALQPSEQTFISKVVSGIESAFGGAFETATATAFGSLQNWFARGFLILVGLVIVAVALAALMWNHGGKQAVAQVGRIAAA